MTRAFVHRSMVVAVLFSSNAFAQTNVADKLDSFIRPFADAGHFYGQVYIARDGKQVYQKAFGFANAELGVRNEIDTRIGIASITKPMTDVIVLKLIEQNKVAFSDRVSRFIPDFPNGDKITVDMLYNHRSGIPHRVMPVEMETVPYTAAEMVEKIKLAKLEFEPGTKSLYSSAGYAVLARILEIASGENYTALLDRYVFKPAGMKSSLEYDASSIIAKRSNDYLLSGHGVMNAPAKDLSFLVGAGSVLSTARDVNAFAVALTSGVYGDSARAGFLKKKTWLATGNTNGHSAEVHVDGAHGYSFAILSNLNTGANQVISQGIQDILEGKSVKAVVPNPVITPRSVADLQQYLGTFEREGGSRFTTVVRNGTFYAGDILLEPTGHDCFFDFKYYGDVCFVRDAAGKILNISWASPGFTSTWVKQP